jgi:HEAT repeat protein
VGPLMTVLMAEGVEDGFRREVGKRLAGIGLPAVGPLIGALDHADFDVYWEASRTLEEIGKPAAERLSRMLRDPKAPPRTRGKAAELLGDIGDPEAGELLLAVLGDPATEVREGAAEALGDLRLCRSVEALIRLLSDEAWQVQWKAAIALGEIGDSRAIEPLVGLLDNPDKYLRKRAAAALGEIGDVAALNDLKARLPRFPFQGERDRDVLAEIRTAIARITEMRQNPDLPIAAVPPTPASANLPRPADKPP